jgi:lipopolysaccharide/colanic/teichoic acid biosynthesis glycosyltransferase
VTSRRVLAGNPNSDILHMTTSNLALPDFRVSNGSLLKRGMDVAGSCFLLMTLAPFLALTALLVKLDSKGPAIFRQTRIGKDGQSFVLWKFRSMWADAPPYERSPVSSSDPRLTRIGRVLRRLSIDELPQLINVLKGEMSLVGPRPEMPFIVEKYSPLERQRLRVKPGITGLWQISPARAVPIHENVEYDLFYIEHGSIFMDCSILLRTVTAVIRGMGAA